LIKALQDEEFDWFLKQQQFMRFRDKSTFINLNKKKKELITPQELPPVEKNEETKSDQVLEAVSFLNEAYTPKKKKFKLNDYIVSANKENKEVIYRKNPQESPHLDWLKWKENSCRLDSFFTILIFSIVSDSAFDLKLFKGQENQKFKETLESLLKAKHVNIVQQCLNGFCSL